MLEKRGENGEASEMNELERGGRGGRQVDVVCVYVVPVDLSAVLVLLVDRVGEDDPEAAEASVVVVVVDSSIPPPPFFFLFFFSASSFANSFSCSSSESRMASIIMSWARKGRE